VTFEAGIVTNMTENRDVRTLRVVRAEKPKPPPSPEAERARRYRARKRGEQVVKRKPGPKPTTETTLREEIRDLERQNADLRLKVRILEERVSHRPRHSRGGNP
jgi:hypothetical protein